MSINKANFLTATQSILKKRNVEYLLNQKLLKMVEIGDLHEVQQLIHDGATLHQLVGMQLDIYNSRSEHDTLLHTAAKLGHVEVVKFLISCGCDVNALTRRKKASPLHYACYPSVPAVLIDVLLDNGSEIEVRDDDNSTPLIWACYLNNTRATKTLIKRNPNVLAVDNFGLTSLEWACHQGHLASTKVLLEAVNYSEAQLTCAYSQAVETGQIKIAKILNSLLGT